MILASRAHVAHHMASNMLFECDSSCRHDDVTRQISFLRERVTSYV